jgi:hypothetical protein
VHIPAAAMAKVFKLSSYPLTISEVVDYLKDPPAELINSIPPSEPKGGEVYLFQGTEDKKGNRDVYMEGGGSLVI